MFLRDSATSRVVQISVTEIAEVSSSVRYEPGRIIEGPELPIHHQLNWWDPKERQKPIRLAPAQLQNLSGFTPLANASSEVTHKVVGFKFGVALLLDWLPGKANMAPVSHVQATYCQVLVVALR